MSDADTITNRVQFTDDIGTLARAGSDQFSTIAPEGRGGDESCPDAHRYWPIGRVARLQVGRWAETSY